MSTRRGRLLDRLGWVAVALTTLFLCSCGGDDSSAPSGGGGSTPPPPAAPAASALSIEITDVTVASPPVVEFTVTNQDGKAFPGLTTSDLRFTVAKLTPGSDGNPSFWQNYVNTTETATVGPGAGNTADQASRENNGTLADHQDGTYTYTFATDITNVTSPVNVSYEPSRTHRLVIQTRGSLPAVNGIYTFRPSDGATTGLFSREIVRTEKCNECHNRLELHDARIDTRYCVTCHNPGSSDANSGNTVDFKVMIHKIHRGEDLPSVQAGGEYAIWGFGNTKHDFSDVVLPQDIRNCIKCHDGSDPVTPQGDNWKTQLSMEACGSCHDDVDFTKDGSANGANDPDGHPGGIVTDNGQCITCHAESRVAGSVTTSHTLPEPIARAKFKLNILKLCGTAVGSDPLCAPGTQPTVTFSVTDPTNNNAPYDVLNDAAITGGSISFLMAWDTRDYHNTDGTGSRPGRANGFTFAQGAIQDNGDGTYMVTSPDILPDGTGTTGHIASGSGTIAFQGRAAGDFDGDGTFTDRVFVKSEVAHFRITDAAVTARRQVVDNAKCNQCHEQVSLHGGSRNGEVGVCVMCHHPNNTDIVRRPDPPDPDLDQKVEEAIDFKRLIHGIHAGAKTRFDDGAGHGFREQGLVVYGFGNNAHDYSHMRFPGILQDCETCHQSGTYQLTGKWVNPTGNGILGTTIATDPSTLDPNWLDPDDDLNVSPTAAVCSSCHDGGLSKAHMEDNGGAVFDQTQPVIDAVVIETCSVCHGPGKVADIELVHAER